jgi:hypothetical protein
MNAQTNGMARPVWRTRPPRLRWANLFPAGAAHHSLRAKGEKSTTPSYQSKELRIARNETKWDWGPNHHWSPCHPQLKEGVPLHCRQETRLHVLLDPTISDLFQAKSQGPGIWCLCAPRPKKALVWSGHGQEVPNSQVLFDRISPHAWKDQLLVSSTKRCP